VTPFEFCGEIWHQKARIVGLPGSEEIMTLLAFFVLRRVTDGQTDGHVATAITRASISRAGKKDYTEKQKTPSSCRPIA